MYKPVHELKPSANVSNFFPGGLRQPGKRIVSIGGKFLIFEKVLMCENLQKILLVIFYSVLLILIETNVVAKLFEVYR